MEFGGDIMNRTVLLNGQWYFYDEIGYPTGPWKSEWDAELAFSAYTLDEQGCGDQPFLYIDSDQLIAGLRA